MRKSPIIIIGIIFFLAFFSLNEVIFQSSNHSLQKEQSILYEDPKEQVPLSSDYTLENPINISSPSDWALYGFITGDGSALNPYVIENIEIQGDGVKTREESGSTHLNYYDVGIYIGAAGNFTIRNCKISSISVGIYLDFSVSTEYKHTIHDVEIDNCGMGIFVIGFGSGGHITVNISHCDVSNCNWVTVTVPPDLDSSFYGGYGMWVRGDVGSIVEFCTIENCSIGLFTSPAVIVVENQLINCGFFFDISFLFLYNNLINNTINGKPLGLFRGEDNLTLSGENLSQYGQLFFGGCHNLHLSDIIIRDSCSFGLIVHFCNNLVLRGVTVENQQIGFIISSDNMIADYLYARNCKAGFCFLRLRDSILTHITLNDNDVPVYAYEIRNTTMSIVRSTKFFIINYAGVTKLYLNSSSSSILVPISNMSEFDCEGFQFQLNELDTYHITGYDPMEFLMYDFIVILYEPSSPFFVVPGFPLSLLILGVLVGISLLMFFIHNKKKLKKS